jgi:hypothetical protein
LYTDFTRQIMSLKDTIRVHRFSLLLRINKQH